MFLGFRTEVCRECYRLARCEIVHMPGWSWFRILRSFSLRRRSVAQAVSARSCATVALIAWVCPRSALRVLSLHVHVVMASSSDAHGGARRAARAVLGTRAPTEGGISTEAS